MRRDRLCCECETRAGLLVQWCVGKLNRWVCISCAWDWHYPDYLPQTFAIRK